MKSFLLSIIVTLISATAISAQINPPGYEREVKQYQEQQKTSFLDRDSLVIVDTTVVFHPETYEETMTVVRSNMSIRDYCIHVLQFNAPEKLSSGQPIKITDPRTYNEMVIQWNPVTAKIDTIQ